MWSTHNRLIVIMNRPDTTCRSARVDGLLFGNNEGVAGKRLHSPTSCRTIAASGAASQEVGQEVRVGEYPFREDAVVTRILRGTKAAGRAVEAKTQHCYYVLLRVGADFKYATLQHVTVDGAPTLPIEWCEDSAFSGYPPAANQWDQV